MTITRHTAAIDLNGDVGEGFGAYSIGSDSALIPLLSSANIACGFHAGDPRTMRETVARCVAANVAIGAHPGLPDRIGFGRRPMEIAPEEAHDDLLYQIGALQAFAHAAGASLRHVKLHGALYHMADRSDPLAEAVVRAVCALDRTLVLFAPPAGAMQRAAEAAGLRLAVEAFADRRYGAGGKLLPRRDPRALVESPDEAARQAVMLAKAGEVVTADGGREAVRADTICIHGDSPHALATAAAVRAALEREGLAVAPPFDSL